MMGKPYELRNGNCKELIKQLADNTIDAIVTDPPYELGFMSKKWDTTGIAYDVELWTECLRVLKPGGHLLAFSGSRTYHRMAVAIEDAGFDIRDQIMWVYGSGFPKSHDVSKAIDKMAGAEREIVGQRNIHYSDSDNWSNKSKSFGKQNFNIPIAPGTHGENFMRPITAPATEAAKEWNGWGTALKPAHEPICVARKPLIGTVAENVLQYGTGAFNIDGCRVGSELKPLFENGVKRERERSSYDTGGSNRTGEFTNQGRWPANLIHDGSAEVLAGFPNVGASTTGKKNPNGSKNGVNKNGEIYGEWGAQPDRVTGYNEPRGSAARFFYCAKASKRDRDEGCGELELKQTHRYGAGIGEGLDPNAPTINRNHHPTVKPTDLMRYLCRLITPPNGLILDPFTGSGSTGKAAILEGFRFLGFEMEPQYIEIATARIEYAIEQKSKQKTEQENTLFGA